MGKVKSIFSTGTDKLVAFRDYANGFETAYEYYLKDPLNRGSYMRDNYCPGDNENTSLYPYYLQKISDLGISL